METSSGAGHVVAGHVQRQHPPSSANPPDARPPPVLDAPELDVSTLHDLLGRAFRARERVVERRLHTRGVRADAGGSGRVGDAAHELGRELADRGGLADAAEDRVEHGRELRPDLGIEAEALQRLERTRDGLVMRAVKADRRRVSERAHPDRHCAWAVPDGESVHDSTLGPSHPFGHRAISRGSGGVCDSYGVRAATGGWRRRCHCPTPDGRPAPNDGARDPAPQRDE